MSQTQTHPPDITALVINQPAPAERRRLTYYWPFIVTLVLLGLDQWTKRAVEEALGPLGSGKAFEWLGGQVRIIYIINKGASFGFLSKADLSWIFTLLALAASLAIFGWYLTRGTRNPWLQFAMGLILGGIVGNLLDRLLQDGGVTDMITLPNVGIFKVFNVADSGITVGVTIVIATMILQGWTESRRQRENIQSAGSSDSPPAQKQEVE